MNCDTLNRDMSNRDTSNCDDHYPSIKIVGASFKSWYIHLNCGIFISWCGCISNRHEVVEFEEQLSAIWSQLNGEAVVDGKVKGFLHKRFRVIFEQRAIDMTWDQEVQNVFFLTMFVVKTKGFTSTSNYIAITL